MAEKTMAALRTLFPEKCLNCGSIGANTGLCSRCHSHVRVPSPNLCALCARPLDFTYEVDTGTEYFCGQCRLDPPPYDAAMYALPYDDPIRKVLHAFKFGGSPYLAGPLAQLGEETLAPWLARRKGALVAPVPLHWRRLYWRGYNHSYLLAKRLAGKAGLRVEEGVLARIRNTDAQIGLNARQRGENVKGAFAVMAPAQVAGRDVVLFDDIITTGATVRECCKELWKAKPNSVAVAALCKTWD